MKVGDSATITRTFRHHDICDIVELCGLVAKREVPGPLIGAMWSTLLGCHLPGPGTLYVQQETQHLRTAALHEPLTATVEVTRLQTERHLVELTTRCVNSEGTLLAEGSALVYVKYLTSPC